MIDTLFILAQKAWSVALGFAGLGFLIGFHEFGHYFFAKLFNVHTPSFSIGFGPQLFSKKYNGTLFSLSAIPLGGYVEIAGLAEPGQGEQESASETGETSFNAKPYYQKLSIMLGGILFNLIFAYGAFIFIFIMGPPKTHLISTNKQVPVIKSVVANSAAEKQGLVSGDKIVEIQGIAINNDIMPIKTVMENNNGEEVIIKIQREGTTEPLLFTLQPQTIQITGESVQSLGISYNVEAPEVTSFVQAIKLGISETNCWIMKTISGFKACRKASAVKEMAGPVMIISMMINAAAQSLPLFFIILAIISINLAILNLVPLPILDGGQVLFVTIESIIGKQIPEKVRMGIHLTTWGLFLLLFIFLTYQDLIRLLTPYFSFMK